MQNDGPGATSSSSSSCFFRWCGHYDALQLHVSSPAQLLWQQYIYPGAKLKMGAALSSRAEWTSASESGGKLDFSKANEALLSDVVRYVEALCRDHPREAEVIFNRPFAWTSSLSLDSLDRLKPPDYTTRLVHPFPFK